MITRSHLWHFFPKMIDILFCNVPMVMTRAPFSAPAILKSIVEKHNFSAKTIDFNIDFNNNTDKELQNFWQFGNGNKKTLTKATQFVNEWCKIILSLQPKWVGISVFAYTCKIATEMLCTQLKHLDPTIMIVIGGNGMGTGGINGDYQWPDTLRTKKIIDAYIRSEAEESIVELLKNNINFPGINNNKKVSQIENLDSYPKPNYHDYNMKLYQSETLPITGSRGCVRHCTFCDIHSHWKKFVYRTGESICNEMKSLSDTHNIYNFSFTDSLVNGSMKAYRDMITILSKHNENFKPISWKGQFIARPSSQMTEEDWRLTKKSGAKDLYIGVESGSDRVRHDIKKKFTNEDLDFCVEMAHKYNVHMIFMMLIGYPTEQEKDFNETMELFSRYQKYKDIIELSLGTTCAILPQTPLYEFAVQNNFELGETENEWWWDKNPSLTLKERFKRRILLGQHCESLGYKVDGNQKELSTMAYIWNHFKNNQTLDRANLHFSNTENRNQQYYS